MPAFAVLPFCTPLPTPKGTPRTLSQPLPQIDTVPLQPQRVNALYRLSYDDWMGVIDHVGIYRRGTIDAMCLTNRALYAIFEHIKVAFLDFYGPHAPGHYEESYFYDISRIEASVDNFDLRPYLAHSVKSLRLENWGCSCDVEHTEHLYIRDYLLGRLVPTFVNLSHLEINNAAFDDIGLQLLWRLGRVHRLVMTECEFTPSHEFVRTSLSDVRKLSYDQQLAPFVAKITGIIWDSEIQAALLFNFRNLEVLETDSLQLLSAGTLWACAYNQNLRLYSLRVCLAIFPFDGYSYAPPEPLVVNWTGSILSSFLARCPSLRTLQLPQYALLSRSFSLTEACPLLEIFEGGILAARHAVHCKILKDLTVIPSDFKNEQIDAERDELVQFVQYMLDLNLLLPCWFIYFGHKTPLTIDDLLTIFGPVFSNVRWCNFEMMLVEQTHRYEIKQLFVKHGESMPKIVHFQYGSFIPYGPKSNMNSNAAFTTYQSWVPLMLQDTALPVCPELRIMKFGRLCFWSRDNDSWNATMLDQDTF